MIVYEYKRVFVKFPWESLYRRIKECCNNPEAEGFMANGAKGITCDFTSSDDVKFLWELDKVDGMQQPFLRRKNMKRGYSIANCYFVETKFFVVDITAAKGYKPNN